MVSAAIGFLAVVLALVAISTELNRIATALEKIAGKD